MEEQNQHEVKKAEVAMVPTVWFNTDVFDPRERGRQMYCKRMQADEAGKDSVTIWRDATGVVVKRGLDEHHFPHAMIQQCINVPFKGK
jgi:hypothetical protein